MHDSYVTRLTSYPTAQESAPLGSGLRLPCELDQLGGPSHTVGSAGTPDATEAPTTSGGG